MFLKAHNSPAQNSPATSLVKPDDSAFGRLTIDLGAVANNHDIIRRSVGASCGIAGVVKANAYGTGMDRVATTLFQKGCQRFFVATPDEGFALRQILPDADIAVFGGGLPHNTDAFIQARIEPVLNSLYDIALWRDAARKRGEALPAIIHLDTGMNRLGLSADDGETLIKDPALLSGLNVIIVMSHFACADEKDHPLTAQQHQRFDKFAAQFPRAQKSLANSSGIFRDSHYHYDMVRPGMAIYGLNPTPETANPMTSVVSLDARILQIRQIKPGDTIGYSATHSFKGAGLTATVGLGYADGFHRAHSGKAKVFWRGTACPLVGRVSMDLVTVDISHLKGPLPQPGDWFEVLGPHQTADQLADIAGTIGYEVLTNSGSRYQRIYKVD